jgi:uncharacterized protein involved in exopolysaccharide biosynthesis
VGLYRQNAIDLGQKRLEQEDLIRNAKVEEANLLLYLNKSEEARISNVLDNKRIMNVAIAEPPAVPLLPANSRSLLVLLGGFLATIVSAGVVFISDYLDPSLRSVDDVTRVLQIPVLAAFPRPESQ